MLPAILCSIIIVYFTPTCYRILNILLFLTGRWFLKNIRKKVSSIYIFVISSALLYCVSTFTSDNIFLQPKTLVCWQQILSLSFFWKCLYFAFILLSRKRCFPWIKILHWQCYFFCQHVKTVIPISPDIWCLMRSLFLFPPWFSYMLYVFFFFKTFVFDFQWFVYEVLGCLFYVNLLRGHWADWICGLMVWPNVVTFQLAYLQILFLSPFISSVFLGLRLCILGLSPVPQFIENQFISFQIAFLCALLWMFSVYLPSVSLME